MIVSASEIEISEMQPQDVREVALLEKEIFSMPWSENGFLTSLQSEDTLYLVVRKKHELIGYCGFYSHSMKRILRM